jgi:hypothetical protein
LGARHSVRGELKLVLLDVDGEHGTPMMQGVLNGKVAETADAKMPTRSVGSMWATRSAF